MKDALIIILVGVLVWFGSVIVEMENYRYAAMSGMCSEYSDPLLRHECLNASETRTHWSWHLLYGLGIF